MVTQSRWLVALAALSVLTLGCSDDDDGAAREEPEAVFSWESDDLHEWVTDDELANAIAEFVPGYAGADLDAVPVNDELTHETNENEGDRDDELAGESQFIQYGWEFRVPGETGTWRVNAHRHDGLLRAQTDPRLPSGATYGPDWGGFMLKGPNSDDVMGLIVNAPPGSSTSEMDRVFAVGSMMLQEMGWAD